MEKVWASLLLCAVALTFAPVGLAQDYTLQNLYHEAVKNSEKIKYAEENLYLTKMGKEKALAVLLPRVTAFGNYTRYSEDKFTVSGALIQPDQAGNWGVRADESFSLSIRELEAFKIAGQLIVKSELDLDTTKSGFLLSVASSYYDVLKAKKALEIAAANVERLTQYRYFVEKRLKVGEVTRTALLRADGELSGAQADYIRSINMLKLARAALVRMTGVEDNFRLKAENIQYAEEGSFENLRQTALNDRTDLKSYDMQIQVAERQVKYARGAFWPSVGFFAIYNGADQSPATATLIRESMLAGVSLTFPFFEGGLRVAELNEARAKERQARLMYDDFKKNVDIELRGAWLDLETQKGTLKFLEDQLVFAQDNYNAVQRQYQNGLATSLDVMDANSLLLTSERNAAEALYNCQLAHLKVRKASGTLLKFVREGY